MDNLTKQLIVSDLAPKFFKIFGNANVKALNKRGADGSISLESVSESMECGDSACLAKSQNAFHEFLIKRMQDNTIMSVVKNIDQEQAQELSAAMAKVDSIKAKIATCFCNEIKDIGKFFQEVSDVDTGTIKKVFATRYAHGFDRLEDEK